VRDARRLPSYTIVARTRMYTYAANVWDLSIVQGPFPAAPRQTLKRYDSRFFRRCERAGVPGTPLDGEKGVMGVLGVLALLGVRVGSSGLLLLPPCSPPQEGR
jgi:hypothetical protein